MEDAVKLTLAGKTYEVAPPPLGKLKKIVASINRVSQDANNVETMMEEAGVALGLLIGKTPAEMDDLNVGFQELCDAFNRVPEICGLVRKGAAQGEAQPG